MPRILRDSLRTLSSSLDQPPSFSEPAHGTTFIASGAGNGDSLAELVGHQPAYVAGAPEPSERSPATTSSSSYSRSTPACPAPEAAWYDATTSSRRPHRACSAPRASIIVSVVQLGLAMMPCGRLRDLGRVDLGHDQRHVGVHPERAGVVDHDRALGGGDRRPHGRDLVGHVEHRHVDAVEGLLGQLLDDERPRRGSAAACRPSGPTRAAGSRPRRPRASTGCRASPCRRRRSRRRRPGSASSLRPSSAGPSVDDGLDLVAVEVERGVRGRTAASIWSSSTITEIRISEVEIISMLTPAEASAAKNRAETPGWRAHAGADQRDLADPVVVQQLLVADLVLEPGQRRHRGLAVVARQRERDVGAAGAMRRRCSARSCRC